jgi:hypothetical protein
MSKFRFTLVLLGSKGRLTKSVLVKTKIVHKHIKAFYPASFIEVWYDVIWKEVTRLLDWSINR